MADHDAGVPRGVRIPTPRRELEQQRARVLLVSDQRLIAESVGAALADRGLVVQEAWVGRGASHDVHQVAAGFRPHAALLICDIEDSLGLLEAAELLRAWSGPWVVLTGPEGSVVRGALLDAGASVVRPSATGLEEVADLLEQAARGEPLLDAADRARLIERWTRVRDRGGGAWARFESLSERQRRVLELMAEGDEVRVVARRLGVSESTVRSHVRELLHKLNVRSQLAAVAAMPTLEDLRDSQPVVRRPDRGTRARS